jgi:hypothetical protein
VTKDKLIQSQELQKKKSKASVYQTPIWPIQHKKMKTLKKRDFSDKKLIQSESESESKQKIGKRKCIVE